MQSSLVRALLCASIVGIFYALPAQAQATRTWVSGELGNDANPCSRTAPCQTFAGAISKTFINGEINCLDPGGFGTINITKSITIDCHENFGSILSSGVNGVIINIPAGNSNDPLRSVRLRNLNINGSGASGTVGTRTGLNGIRIIAASHVSIEDTLVTNFAQNGILDERASGRLTVSNSIVHMNGAVGLRTQPPSGSSSLWVAVDNVIAEGNGIGMAFINGAQAMVDRSTVSNNSNSGIESDAIGGAAPQVNVDNSKVTHNGVGLFTFGGGVMRLSNTSVAFNGAGVTGTVQSFSNNRFSGNGAGGTIVPIGGATSDTGQQ